MLSSHLLSQSSKWPVFNRFPTKTPYAFLASPIWATFQIILTLEFITITIIDDTHKDVHFEEYIQEYLYSVSKISVKALDSFQTNSELVCDSLQALMILEEHKRVQQWNYQLVGTQQLTVSLILHHLQTLSSTRFTVSIRMAYLVFFAVLTVLFTSVNLHTFLFEITKLTRASSSRSSNDLQQTQQLHIIMETQ